LLEILALVFAQLPFAPLLTMNAHTNNSPFIASSMTAPVDVFLVQYQLSYSAYFPAFFRYFVRVFENRALPMWLSHYSLHVGHFYFDPHRKGTLPFASVTYFRFTDDRDEMEMEQTFGKKVKWTTDVEIGTTTVQLEEIIPRRMLVLHSSRFDSSS
jgi:hypothetical protein